MKYSVNRCVDYLSYSIGWVKHKVYVLQSVKYIYHTSAQYSQQIHVPQLGSIQSANTCTTPRLNKVSKYMYHTSAQYSQQIHVPQLGSIQSANTCTTPRLNTVSKYMYHTSACQHVNIGQLRLRLYVLYTFS